MPVSSHAQESDSTVIVSTDDKIVMIKDMGLIENEKMTFTFYVHNTGNIAATNITFVPSSLTMKEGLGAFSWAPSVVDRGSVLANANGTGLGPQEILLANYTIKEDVREKILFNEATYVGTLKIVGDNFEEQTVEVEITFRYNPAWYFVFTIVGVAMAIITGHVFYTKWEMTRKIAEEAADDIDIIDDINGHITNVNFFRKTINSSAWNNIRKEYDQKTREIERYRDGLNLSADAEAVTWFKLLDESVHANKIFDANDPNSTNSMLPLIDDLDKKIRDKKLQTKIQNQRKFNLKLATFLIKKILRKPIVTYREIQEEGVFDFVYQKPERKRKEEEIKRVVYKKTIYVVAVAIVSSIASILANATFLGNIVVTAGVGIAIGFTAYRLQDISGLLAPAGSNK
jgi:hypothetical protein